MNSYRNLVDLKNVRRYLANPKFKSLKIFKNSTEPYTKFQTFEVKIFFLYEDTSFKKRFFFYKPTFSKIQ